LFLSFGVVSAFGFEFFLDAGGVDNDRGFAVDRAFIFTDAAACAFLFYNSWPLFVVAYDGMIGALLIADKANFIRIPGNTPCFVDMSNSHLEKAFLFNRKMANRFGWTNPSTKITEFFTVTDTRNEPRRVKTRQPCL
jgi:hypothetical protein